MQIIISPAKQMTEADAGLAPEAWPQFQAEAELISAQLEKLSVTELQTLYQCSESIAKVNFQRLQQRRALRQRGHERSLAAYSPALLSYSGIQYQAMGARVLTQDQYAYLQKHLFILSALYGALRPLDGVSPYRLEMQAKFCPQPGTDLYAFWRPRLTTALLAGAREAGDACDKPLLINLASAEYAKAVDKTLFTWLDVRFLERTKQGKWAERAVTCKKARGAMVSFLAERQADNPQILQEFTAFNMVFDPAASTELCLIFRQESD